jgi:hypothetical protein
MRDDSFRVPAGTDRATLRRRRTCQVGAVGEDRIGREGPVWSRGQCPTRRRALCSARYVGRIAPKVALRAESALDARELCTAELGNARC